jgi:hypothetical protein
MGLTAGEVVSITITVDSGSPVVDLEVPVGEVRDTGAAPTTLSYTAEGGETSVVAANTGTGEFSFAWSCTAAPDPITPEPEATPPAPIPAWVQAYGRSGPEATCENGWDASWQSWAEPVTSGWVCTRSIPSLG